MPQRDGRVSEPHGPAVDLLEPGDGLQEFTAAGPQEARDPNNLSLCRDEAHIPPVRALQPCHPERAIALSRLVRGGKRRFNIARGNESDESLLIDLSALQVSDSLAIAEDRDLITQVDDLLESMADIQDRQAEIRTRCRVWNSRSASSSPRAAVGSSRTSSFGSSTFSMGWIARATATMVRRAGERSRTSASSGTSAPTAANAADAESRSEAVFTNMPLRP